MVPIRSSSSSQWFNVKNGPNHHPPSCGCFLQKNVFHRPFVLPSGKLTVCYWKWPFLVEFPIENGDFPYSYVATLTRGKRIRELKPHIHPDGPWSPWRPWSPNRGPIELKYAAQLLQASGQIDDFRWEFWHVKLPSSKPWGLKTLGQNGSHIWRYMMKYDCMMFSSM